MDKNTIRLLTGLSRNSLNNKKFPILFKLENKEIFFIPTFLLLNLLKFKKICKRIK